MVDRVKQPEARYGEADYARMRRLIREEGLSMQQVADLMGCSRSLVDKVWNGGRRDVNWRDPRTGKTKAVILRRRHARKRAVHASE